MNFVDKGLSVDNGCFRYIIGKTKSTNFQNEKYKK